MVTNLLEWMNLRRIYILWPLAILYTKRARKYKCIRLSLSNTPIYNIHLLYLFSFLRSRYLKFLEVNNIILNAQPVLSISNDSHVSYIGTYL